MAFVVQKCVQNLDEVVLGHAIEGVYRLKMKWLQNVPFALHQDVATYFDLLQKSTSTMQHIAMFEFYGFNGDGADTALLADCCILRANAYHQTEDSLILLDANLKPELKALRVMALCSADTVQSVLEEDKPKAIKSKGAESKKISRDINLVKPFEMTEIEEVGRNLKALLRSFKTLPSDFSISNVDSLRWFLDNVKERVEREVFEKMDVVHLLMDERRHFIETQTEEYIAPQIQVIEGRVGQIVQSNQELREKAQLILKNQEELESKIKGLMGRTSGTSQMGSNSSLEALRLVLLNSEKAVMAATADFKQFEQYKLSDPTWKMDDGVPAHLEAHMKRLCKNSDQMLKEQTRGVKEVLKQHSL